MVPNFKEMGAEKGPSAIPYGKGPFVVGLPFPEISISYPTPKRMTSQGQVEEMTIHIKTISLNQSM